MLFPCFCPAGDAALALDLRCKVSKESEWCIRNQNRVYQNGVSGIRMVSQHRPRTSKAEPAQTLHIFTSHPRSLQTPFA